MKFTRFLLVFVIMLIYFLIPQTVFADEDTLVEDTKIELAAATLTADPYADKQWALSKIQSLPIYESIKGQESIVAVLDTGIDCGHEDLSGSILKSICFSDSLTTSDVNGHGTHISGLIAAHANNNVGIAGAAPNVKILNVKVAEDNGIVWSSNVARGIMWAVDNGAKVINMSLAAPQKSAAMEQAVKYAWDKGVVLVAAAGNYVHGKTYPAAFPDVIAVAALDQSDDLWADSNDGDFVDAYAPGVGIYSTLPTNSYGFNSGSSMAAAYISAFASLAVSSAQDTNCNGFVNDEVVELIKSLFKKPLFK